MTTLNTLSLSILNGDKPESFSDIVPALESLRGVTLETANVVPDLLLHEPVGGQRLSELG